VEKKRLIAAIIISALLFSAVAGTQFVISCAANPYHSIPYNGPPNITINLPLANETYSSNTVPLEFTITRPLMWLTNRNVSGKVFRNQLSLVSIVIDGKLYRKLRAYTNLSSPFSYCYNLTNLEDGTHNLTIIAHCEGWDLEMNNFWHKPLSYDASSDLLVFTVDTSPFVSVLSPKKASYESTENLLDVALNFTVNEPVSRLSYSLDGEENVTIAGNTTLANLPYGEHNITVYATDYVGNIGASKAIPFTIVKLTPEPESLPATMIMVPIGSVAFVGVCLMVYLKKRKS